MKLESLKAGLLSLAFLALFLGVWHLATLPKGETQGAADEYAKLMGKGAKKSDGFPTLGQMREAFVTHVSDPFYDRGSNDKGIGIQLGHSLGRVALGYLIACLIAVPLGFLIGMSPLLYRALNPFIQLLKPISPLAWMPIALYTIKDSSISGVFVIFICSVWPMMQTNSPRSMPKFTSSNTTASGLPPEPAKTFFSPWTCRKLIRCR